MIIIRSNKSNCQNAYLTDLARSIVKSKNGVENENWKKIGKDLTNSSHLV